MSARVCMLLKGHADPRDLHDAVADSGMHGC